MFKYIVETVVGQYSNCQLCGYRGDEKKCPLCGGKMAGKSMGGLIRTVAASGMSSGISSSEDKSMEDLITEITQKAGGSNISSKYTFGGDRDPVRTKCWYCDKWMSGNPTVEPIPYTRCPHCKEEVWVTYVKEPTGWTPMNLDPHRTIDPQVEANFREMS